MTDGSIDTNTAILCVEDQATYRVELDSNPDHHLRVYLAWYVCPPPFDCIQLDWRIGCGLWTGIRTIDLKLFSLKYLLEISAMSWFLTSCIADLLITVTLVIFLVYYKLF